VVTYENRTYQIQNPSSSFAIDNRNWLSTPLLSPRDALNQSDDVIQAVLREFETLYTVAEKLDHGELPVQGVAWWPPVCP